MFPAVVGPLVGDAVDRDESPVSFFSTLKNEWLHRFVFTTRAKAKRQVIRYIEGFYNHRRLHSALGYRPPLEVLNESLQSKQPHMLRP
ncbi:transposase [Nonomuraea sp. FMUSA5-5]|uniref:Transposase n=1 Tax=Nonomuraea composti TaxID=2720023 RepID=A0ABX1BF69_9ACTN|nr:transposase [Nonomuraea sp. FMUSA5-5]